MKKKQSKWMVVTIATVLGCSLLMTQSPTLANSVNDLKKEQKQLDQKSNQLNSSINQKKNDISINQTNQERLQAQIQTLDSKIQKTSSEIDNIQGDIKRTNVEIEKLQESIKILKKKIAERDELIKERLRAVQVSGGSVDYIDVLLGASSFADFIDRFSAVSTLMDADKKILKEQADDKILLEEQKTSVEEKLTQQKQSRDRLVNLKANLDSQKVSKDKLVDQLETKLMELTKDKHKLEEEHEEVLEVSKEVGNKVEAEQSRLIEVARQAETVSAPASAAPVTSSGTWTRPAAGQFSSTFGGRNIGSGDEFHYGSDIANSIGTQIVSAASGVVSHAGPMGTYGNVIMVTHSINGQIFTTVYAHLSAINVRSGQSVSKGQAIGKMGSSGRSTGSHLHFEVHVGPWNGARSNAVNPIGYVSF
ncbi:murein hydrolase activator EnvC family protein [Paenisporosarcina sp. TG-14]|uniref:murein hydrolase activator EnvC family protein n=1 Tax=Paenisporosarcina sp. TG-14 TaxID=1231057 RepID=UPI0002F449F5|nr:M23 family metallopeptidase [Paenisporosarcina sp. TG-14]